MYPPVFSIEALSFEKFSHSKIQVRIDAYLN